MYQRDRGELDWDAQSVASTVLLSPSGIQSPGSNDGRWSNSEYQNYLTSGPNTPAPLATPLELLTDQRHLMAVNRSQQSEYFSPHTHHPSMYSNTPTSPDAFTAVGPAIQHPQTLSWYSYSDQSTPQSPAEYSPQTYHAQPYSLSPVNQPPTPEVFAHQQPVYHPTFPSGPYQQPSQ